MRTSRRAKSTVRLNCEALEDRLTPALAYALTDVVAPTLIAFDTATPTNIISSVPVLGVAATEVLVGIDFRPATGSLYGLGVNAGADTATLYIINVATGTATPVGPTGGIAFTDGVTPVDLPDPGTVGYGIDFNPAADRFRVVVGALNFRVNPNDGAPVDGNNTGNATPVVAGINPDGDISGTLPTGTNTVDATAYTNSRASTGGPTIQYTLDAASNRLFIQTPPNSGDQTAGVPVQVGIVPLDFDDVNGFDIPEGATPTTGLAALTVGLTTQLYTIDLATGAATSLGTIGLGTTGIRGFSLAPAGTIQFQSATATVAEEGGNAAITLTRTGGTTGTITATVTVTGGTATAGTDFTGGPYVVTFLDGETTKTLSIPITPDTLAEGDETVALTISTVTAGAIGAQATNTLTITDNDFTVAFQNATATVAENGTATIALTRTGGISAAATATVTVTGGTATAGTDFTGGPYTVNFAAGSATGTLSIPTTDDALVEGDETVTLTISAASAGGTIGAQATNTLTITDNDVAPPPAPPASPPPPVYTSATVIGNTLVLTGSNGTQNVPVPSGSFVIFTDVTGDGAGDVILFTPDLAVAVDGQTGRFLALSADLNGDRVRDLLIFNLDGTTTTTDGRTGIVVTS